MTLLQEPNQRWNLDFVSDSSVIIRAPAGREAELVTRRWSWPGPGGRPVYKFRSDGRDIAAGRCLIPADGFFELTDPPDSSPKRAPKSKWRFSVRGLAWFCIAGGWRTHPKVGEAWSMLTTGPGPDIAPYHNRQVVVLTPADYVCWLDPAVSSGELCRTLPQPRWRSNGCAGEDASLIGGNPVWTSQRLRLER